ncbi:MAG: hypothetical protein ACOZAO_04325 [Patescibacteria group bacterium]
MSIFKSLLGDDDDEEIGGMTVHIIGFGESDDDAPGGLFGLLSLLAGAIGPNPENLPNQKIIDHLNGKREDFADKKVGHWYSHALLCPMCHSMMEALVERLDSEQMPEGDEPFGVGADMIIKALKALK